MQLTLKRGFLACTHIEFIVIEGAKASIYPSVAVASMCHGRHAAYPKKPNNKLSSDLVDGCFTAAS